MEFLIALLSLIAVLVGVIVILIVTVTCIEIFKGIMIYYKLKKEKSERLYFVYKLKELTNFVSAARVYQDLSWGSIQYKQEVPQINGKPRIYQVNCRPDRLYLEFFFHKSNGFYDTIIGIPKNVFVFLGGIAFISLRNRKEKNIIKKANKIN